MTDHNAFLQTALIPRNAAHVSGSLDDADRMLASDPALAHANIFTAAVLGDHDFLLQCIEADAAVAVSRGGPYEWDVLTHVCFSRYFQHRTDTRNGFAACVRLLLAAGASANTGFFENDHQPKPEWESVLYAASGIAHDPVITQILVDAGADVNDVEVTYHSPETYDNRALEVLVNSGRVQSQGLTIMLLRKFDWHDYDGAKWLLEHGADPNEPWNGNGLPPLPFAITRDNRIENIDLLLDHGADALQKFNGRMPGMLARATNGIEIAAVCGRGDVLRSLESRGLALAGTGASGLITACALGDGDRARALLSAEPGLMSTLQTEAAPLLARFALTGNTAGVRALLDVGISAKTPIVDGDGYWDIATNSTALHVATWRGHHDVVSLLVARGANVNAVDGRGRSPLQLAIRAAVDSYWMNRRSPESVQALLAAGAATTGVDVPTGYAEIDPIIMQAADNERGDSNR